MKIKIWDNQSKSYVENSASLHCVSRWCVDAETGNVIDVVTSLDGKHMSISEDMGWWMDGDKVVVGPRYIVK